MDQATYRAGISDDALVPGDGRFPGETSCLTLAWAVMLAIGGAGVALAAARTEEGPGPTGQPPASLPPSTARIEPVA